MIDSAQSPQQLRRRTMLKLLAAAPVAGATASTILTAPAFADFGSPNCLPTNGASPVTVMITEQGSSTNVNWAVVAADVVAAACPPDAPPRPSTVGVRCGWG